LIPFALAALLAVAPRPSPQVEFERGQLELSMNRLDAAVRAYRSALEGDPMLVPAMNGLGIALFWSGKKDEAIAQFQKAIATEPTFALAYLNLGWAARQVKDFDTAVAAYEKYIVLAPQDADGLYGLGESYRLSGRPQDALTALGRYVESETRPTEKKWVDKAKATIEALKVEVEAAAKPEGIAEANPR